MSSRRLSLALIALTLAGPFALEAQTVDCAKVTAVTDHATMDHAKHRAQLAACASRSSAATPALPGQAAFGAVAEVVRILQTDPATDWSLVNVEALRRHLIDMDDVTVRSTIVHREVAGGFSADITGPGTTTAAIRRMVPTHASMYASSAEFVARTQQIPGGVRLTLTARDASNTSLVAKLRGLGTIGFLTDGDHHSAHHLAIARGDKAAHSH